MTAAPKVTMDEAAQTVTVAFGKSIPSSSRSVYFPLLAMTSYQPATISKVDAYANKHLAPTSRRSAQTTVATIKARIKVRSEQLPAIDEWLARQS